MSGEIFNVVILFFFVILIGLVGGFFLFKL